MQHEPSTFGRQRGECEAKAAKQLKRLRERAAWLLKRPQRHRLPLSRLHELQRELGGHAPQRHEQRERRRYQHNRGLELGRVAIPLRNVGELIVA